ncbi:hypothetical protein [Actinoallomurus sp. NPDC050550]|uniref:ATP-binding protein n=1 Tax=Actinoallomurus sp. NPDC050550 TaxID=3154937 RepID=UPI0033DBC7BC
MRHSGAEACEISVVRQGRTAVLSVRDDGRGAPAPSETSQGNGLRGLVERISGAEGRLEAGPADGGGYRLTITLPLKESIS